MKKFFPLFYLLVAFVFTTGRAQDETNKPPAKSTPKPKIQYGIASFYSDKFNGRKTSNGEIFNQQNMKTQKPFNHLKGIIHGISSDGRITRGEFAEMKLWCQAHEGLCESSPFKEFFAEVKAILDDGTMTAEEVMEGVRAAAEGGEAATVEARDRETFLVQIVRSQHHAAAGIELGLPHHRDGDYSEND